jgi:hypothetical protein
MTMQTEHRGHRWVDSLGAQMTLAVVAIVGVIAIAWYLVF